MADDFPNFLHHNAWATKRLLQRCRALTPAHFTQRFDIGPGSLHDTLLHIVGAMRRWADRIGERPVRPSVEDEDRTWTPDEIIELLAEAETDLESGVGAVVDGDRLGELMAITIRGRDEPFRFTRGAAVVHVLTHGAHHRAQALNMMRRLGVADLPEIDAIECELDGRPASW